MILAAGKGMQSVYPKCRVREAVHLGGFIVVKCADSSQVPDFDDQHYILGLQPYASSLTLCALVPSPVK